MTDTAFLVDDTVKQQMSAWQRDLGAVRRLAPKTLEAYSRDLSAFLAFLAYTYGRVTDMNLTPQSVRYDGARRRNTEKELPERIRELRDVEAMIANRIAGVVDGEFGMYRQLLVGGHADIGRDSLESYIRYAMTKAALKDAGQDTGLSLAASVGAFFRSRPPKEVDDFNETYLSYLSKWQQRIKKDGTAGLDAMVTEIFPAFKGFREATDAVARKAVGGAPQAELARFGERIESMHLAGLSDRAEYLKYRIVATRYALEQKQQKNPDAFEAFFKHGIIKTLDGASSVPIVEAEARTFNALLTLAERLTNDEREFQKIKSAGTQLWMRRWKKVGGTWQIPKEFRDDLESGARNPLAMGVGPTMLDATVRELDALAELQADEERMADQLTRVNTEAIPAMQQTLREGDDDALRAFADLQPSFGIALGKENAVPELQIALLDADARTVAAASYPSPVPDLERDDAALVEDITRWFAGPGKRELEARRLHAELEDRYWQIKKNLDSRYPDLIVPLTTDTRELADFVHHHRVRQYQMAALSDLHGRRSQDSSAGLTPQELASFRDPQLLTAGFAELPGDVRAIESIFSEARSAIPRGFSGAYDITNNELLVRKGDDVARIPLQEYEHGKTRHIDAAVKSLSRE